MDIPSLPPIPLESVGTPVPLWVAQFLEPLVATPLDDGVNWQVVEAFDFESEMINRIITVPAGFITDFASIPRLFWTLVGGPTGPYTKPSCLHDYCYRTPKFCTRLQADTLLWEAMKVMAVPRLTMLEVYEGVRVGGARSYRGGL